MNTTEENKVYYEFDCGCKIEVLDETIKECDGLPSMEIDFYNIPRDCPRTWDVYKSGRTRGVLQLEGSLGQEWSKKIEPNCIEEASALIALIRPGCISGKTKILTGITNSNGKVNRKYATMEEIFKNKSSKRFENIISYDEENGKYVKNRVEDVFYTGDKPVYKMNVSIYKNLRPHDTGFYDLVCTADHRILTPNGYKMLKDLIAGDRIALNLYRKSGHTSRNNPDGAKYFTEICHRHYEHRCIFCDWKDGNLDVNHIDGNREVNNSKDNLCFLCPNHHRMYSEGNLSSEQLLSARKEFRLPESDDIVWGTFLSKEYVGEESVYDITMQAPHHNFIAGNTVVHNCLKAFSNGKSMTEHYASRKRGETQADKTIECLKPILDSTFFVLCFQEQAMRIAMDIAGYNEEEADVLRKAIGKKDAELMASLESSFLTGCAKINSITQDEAKEIFGWIRESQRYSFNASHSVGYADLGYWTAYAKAHFPVHFFCAWIGFSGEKTKPKWEIRDLIFDCQLHDIPVYPPSILKFYGGNTSSEDGKITVGTRHISCVGDAVLKEMVVNIEQIEDEIGVPLPEWNFVTMMLKLMVTIRSDALNNMISAGTFDHLGLSRREMIHQYKTFKSLSLKEQDYLKENYKNYDTFIDAIQDLCYRNQQEKPLSTKKRVPLVEEALEELKNPPFSMKDDPKWIARREKAVIGKSISMHNTDAVSNIVTNTTCREFLDGKDARNMTLIGEVNMFKEYSGKGDNKNRKMCVLSLEDATGSINAMCFFDLYEAQKEVFIEGNVITVKINRSRDGKAIINEIL